MATVRPSIAFTFPSLNERAISTYRVATFSESPAPTSAETISA
jgi:hypothetical protein